jgi:iron complex outermembrane receptor protein
MLETAGMSSTTWLANPVAVATINIDRWAWGARASSAFTFRDAPGAPVISVGVDAQWQRDDRLNTRPDGSTVTRDQLERVTEIGPFVQGTVRAGDVVSITAGGRYDRVSYDVEDRLVADGDRSGSTTMDAFSGTLGVTASVSPSFAPYASVGTSFETPTTTEIVNRPEGGGGINPEIGPQTTLNYELGVRGVVGIFDYNVTGFRADVEGELIPFEVPTEPGRTFFRNAGETRHQGLELGGGFDLPAGLSLIGAYTFADYSFTEFRTETDTLDGNTIPGVPQHKLHLSAGWASTLGLWVAVDYNYSSSLVANDANSAFVDAWMVTTIRIGWDGRIGAVGFRPYFSVLNVFDESYVGSVVVNAFGGRFYEPAPGRNAILGVEIGGF